MRSVTRELTVSPPRTGLLELIISLSAVVGGHAAGWLDLTIIYTRFINLAIASLIFSLVLTVYCYLISFVPGTLLAESGSSGACLYSSHAVVISSYTRAGNPVYDLFMGRALTPRFLGLDLKFFCEQRPGLSAWALINIACLVQQYNTEGYISNGMWVAVGLSVFYVIDTFIFEVRSSLGHFARRLMWSAPPLAGGRADDRRHHDRRLWLHACRR